jgi:hypothetical protein
VSNKDLPCASSMRRVIGKDGFTAFRGDQTRRVPGDAKAAAEGAGSQTLTVPAKFKATPIEDGVSILMEDRRKRTNELQAKTAVLVKNLGDQPKISGGKRAEFCCGSS